MAATVEESTPPDIATAMVLESGIVGSFGVFHLDASGTDPQHFFGRHEEQPIVVPFVCIVEIVGARNYQSEVPENECSLQLFPVEPKIRQRRFFQPSDGHGDDVAV